LFLKISVLKIDSMMWNSAVIFTGGICCVAEEIGAAAVSL